MLCVFDVKILSHASAKKQTKTNKKLTRQKRFQISHFDGSFSNEIMAVKRLSLSRITDLIITVFARPGVNGCGCQMVQIQLPVGNGADL